MFFVVLFIAATKTAVGNAIIKPIRKPRIQIKRELETRPVFIKVKTSDIVNDIVIDIKIQKMIVEYFLLIFIKKRKTIGIQNI